MLTDVLPELVMGGAQMVRRLVDRPPPGGAPFESADSILRQSFLTLDFVRDYHDRISSELDQRGMDPTVLRNACQTCMNALDVLADAHRRLLNLSILDTHREEVRRLEAFAAEIRRSFDEWSEVLSRPTPPIDRERLQRGLDEAARGEFVRVETYEDLFVPPSGE